jgi:hypothetical protein
MYAELRRSQVKQVCEVVEPSGRVTTGLPAQEPMFLSVVMPAYNEQAAIETVVLDHFRFLEKMGDRVPHWEVVCVDDASRDRTRNSQDTE